MPRQRKPTAIMELTGAFRKDPQLRRDNEPPSVGPFPAQPPDHLADDIKAAWEEIVEVVPFGVLGGSDRFIVEVCAILVAEMRRETMNSARITQLRIALGALGLTPADRARLTVDRKEPNPFDEF